MLTAWKPTQQHVVNESDPTCIFLKELKTNHARHQTSVIVRPDRVSLPIGTHKMCTSRNTSHNVAFFAISTSPWPSSNGNQHELLRHGRDCRWRSITCNRVADGRSYQPTFNTLKQSESSYLFSRFGSTSNTECYRRRFQEATRRATEIQIRS